VAILLNRFSKSSLTIRRFRALVSTRGASLPLGRVRGRRNGRLRSLKGVLEGIREKFVGAGREGTPWPEESQTIRPGGSTRPVPFNAPAQRVCAGVWGQSPHLLLVRE
jgi:hypothetical protein